MPSNIVDRKTPVPYSPEIALVILDHVADGDTLVDIEKVEGLPTRKTIYRWLSIYPKFYDAYMRAKELSATSLEDKALAIAAMLEAKNDFTGAKVTALNYAMQQYRWSAARRNRAEYGDQAKVGPVTVPIQIVTSLNLGQDGGPAPTDNATSVYTVEATVYAGPSGIRNDGMEEEDEGPMIDVTPEPGDNDSLPFDMPLKGEQDLHRPKNGRPLGSTRPKARRKSPKKAAATARVYARAQQKDEE